MTVPGNDFKNCSNQLTLSASKWLVGSSNSNISGLLNNSLVNATRLLSPPESTAILASSGGHLKASIANSNV